MATSQSHGLAVMVRVLAAGALTASLFVLAPSQQALAHGGGLNSEGCHNNRQTGDYHCHRASASKTPQRQPARSSGGSRAFANCSEARAAGAAPVRRGEPGYAPRLDRDGDGVGCE